MMFCGFRKRLIAKRTLFRVRKKFMKILNIDIVKFQMLFCGLRKLLITNKTFIWR